MKTMTKNIAIFASLISFTTFAGCSGDDKANSSENQGDEVTHTQDLCVSYEECDDGLCEVAAPCQDNEPDIATENPTEKSYESCKDELDNDGDGAIDCNDNDCKVFDYCIESANLENECQDGIDNDGDLEADCDDEDCKDTNYCKNFVDEDWIVEGETCVASEIGMIKDSTDPAQMGHNHYILKQLIENKKLYDETTQKYTIDTECSNLKLDGHYHFMPVTKDNNPTSGSSPILVKRLFRIYADANNDNTQEKAGIFDLGDYKSGFIFDSYDETTGEAIPNNTGGFVMENLGVIMKGVSHNATNKINGLQEDRYEHPLFNGYYKHKFHGTLDRIMIRNCTLDTPLLFKIAGVSKHYDTKKKDYKGNSLTVEELEEYGTRINRITVKDCTGVASGSLSDVGVLNKVEFIGNNFKIPIKQSISSTLSWSATNELDLEAKIIGQGKSHVIFRNNTITGPDDIYLITAWYTCALLTESTKVNFENNKISNLMVRGISGNAGIEESTGEPIYVDKDTKAKTYIRDVKKGEDKRRYYLVPEVYDAYLSSTQVVSRNNEVKNVMGLGSHYRSNILYFTSKGKLIDASSNELFKGKKANYRSKDYPKIRRFENNTYTIDASVVRHHIDRILDGGEFRDGTSLSKMYVTDASGDQKGVKRELTPSERQQFIDANTTWSLSTNYGAMNLKEVTYNNNTVNLEDLYLEGTYYLSTKNFTALNNTIKAKAIKLRKHTLHVFSVFPFAYYHEKKDYYSTENYSLNTTIDVQDNKLILSDTDAYNVIKNYPEDCKRYKLADGSKLPGFPLVVVSGHRFGDDIAKDKDGNKLKTEIKKLTFRNNTDKDGNTLYWCRQPDDKSWNQYEICYDEDMKSE